MVNSQYKDRQSFRDHLNGFNFNLNKAKNNGYENR